MSYYWLSMWLLNNIAVWIFKHELSYLMQYLWWLSVIQMNTCYSVYVVIFDNINTGMTLEAVWFPFKLNNIIECYILHCIVISFDNISYFYNNHCLANLWTVIDYIFDYLHFIDYYSILLIALWTSIKYHALK